MSEVKKTNQSYHEKVAEKNAAAKDLSRMVISEIKKVLHPDAYIKFLDTVERFHWYSYLNSLLIFSQFPQAQCLAGFDVWKNTALSTYNDPNRRILKESGAGQGIKLIAPFTVVNNTSRSLINVVVPVYDVNQINDIPPPVDDFLDLSKCNYVDMINAIKFVAPYSLNFAYGEDKNLSRIVKGYCNHELQQFIIDDRLSVRGKLSVLLHEYSVACVYLSGYKNNSLQELIEESVFYILTKHFCLPVEDITFSHIGKYRSFSEAEIAAALHLTQTISHSIIDKTEDALESIVAFTPAFEDPSYQVSLFDDLKFEMEGMADEV